MSIGFIIKFEFDVLISYSNSGFRQGSFIFLYPFLLSLLVHVWSNTWYTFNLVLSEMNQSNQVTIFSKYCTNDLTKKNLNLQRCTCIHEHVNDRYLFYDPCVKMKFTIQLARLLPIVRYVENKRFISIFSSEKICIIIDLLVF